MEEGGLYGGTDVLQQQQRLLFFVNRRNEIELFAYAPGRQILKRSSNNILLLRFFMTAAGPRIFSVDLLHHAGRSGPYV